MEDGARALADRLVSASPETRIWLDVSERGPFCDAALARMLCESPARPFSLVFEKPDISECLDEMESIPERISDSLTFCSSNSSAREVVRSSLWRNLLI
jgi:hypothetical protein